jgi:predicted acyl esterase
VREESSWPLEGTDWRPLHLTAAALATAPSAAAGHITFDMRARGACWQWTIPADTEITGPTALRLWAEARGADDIDLFAGVEKWRGDTYIPFEGSYGFGRDRITTGWLKASLRTLDEQGSRPIDPVPTCSHRQPLAPGQAVQADIALGPSATFFRVGETLRLVVAGRWLWPLNPLTGQIPGRLPERPQRQVHPALGTPGASPPPRPHHSMTGVCRPPPRPSHHAVRRSRADSQPGAAWGRPRRAAPTHHVRDPPRGHNDPSGTPPKPRSNMSGEYLTADQARP